MTDLDRLAAARRVVRRERRRTADEREAVVAFRTAVREVSTERGRPASPASPASPTSPASPVPPGLRTDPGSEAGTAGGVATVREAYERTVMAVPHYEEEYGDTLEESLEAEFGPEVAAGLATHDRLASGLKRAVLDAAEATHTERERFLEALAVEADSLRESEGRLDAVLEELDELAEESTPDFGALDAVRARLCVLGDECDAVADDRQATLREWQDRFEAPVGTPDLPRYLYGGLDATYPVLATVAEVGERTRRLRRHVERRMAAPPRDADA